MRIGLLSDTHGLVDSKVFDLFASCDQVWHAGDIGTMAVAEQLQAFKPLRAVHGNVDDKEIQIRFPEDLFFTCEDISVWMTHIGGVPPHYKPRIKKILKSGAPDVFICGHSHILRVGRDRQFNNLLYINPGAAGNHGFHHTKTLVRFEINGTEIKNMEAIELGKRGKIT
jgi:putative phosphoesterase